MKKLKFICMPVSGNGGIETVLVKVLNYLSKKYRLTLYLTSVPNNDLWLTDMNKEIRVQRISSNNKLNKLWYLTRIFLTAANDDHFIILGANIIPFAAKIRLLTGKKYQITSWIHYSLEHQNIFDPHKLLFADDHWAISSSIQKSLIEMGVESSKIHLIFNPIERYNDKLNEPRVDNWLRLVYVGRITLHGQKNMEELFKGVARYRQHDAIRVDLFGTQPNPDEISNAIQQLHINSEIHIHSWTSDPWKVIINDIHPRALIMSSAFEGLPMVSLEALSRGIPCILPNFAGVEDVASNGLNGFIYQQGSLDDMDSKLTKMFHTSFNPEKVRDSIEKFYYDQYFARLDIVLKTIQ